MYGQWMLAGWACAACVILACVADNAAGDGGLFGDPKKATPAPTPAPAPTPKPTPQPKTKPAAVVENVPFAVPDAEQRKLIDALMKAENPGRSLAADGNNVQPYMRLAILALGVKDEIPELRGADPMVTIAASFAHDIGGGGVAGETAGPDKARALLTRMGKDPAFIDRVSKIVGNHHLSHPMAKGVDDTPELYIIVICDSHSWTAKQQAELSDKAKMIEYLKTRIVAFQKRAKFTPPATQP